MNAKTCHFIKHESTYFGVSHKKPSIFGFTRIQDAQSVKKHIQNTGFTIQQKNPYHFILHLKNPLPRNKALKLAVTHLDDVYTSAYFAKLNQTDLVFIDDIRVQPPHIHMYSNFSMEMELSQDVQVEHLQCLYDNKKINYNEKFQELVFWEGVQGIEDEEGDYI